MYYCDDLEILKKPESTWSDIDLGALTQGRPNWQLAQDE